MPGLIGRKLGMTRIFTDEGRAIPVTVLEAGPCPVVQVKKEDRDGYAAVQIGFGAKKHKRTSRAELGHASRAGLDAAPRLIREFHAAEDEAYKPGQQLTVGMFEAGQKVRVTGVTKGRGFQGVVKRHGFVGRPASHGHPMARTPGSMGPGTDPSRVIKGKKLPGRMGGNRETIRNLQVVRVDSERNLIFIQGGVPGSRNSYVLIRK
ncbi:MAG: 50S ribosomal protein L3 [Gemmatimonadetes bacterium]|nr:50S ribosomal protein L3 [Gemmatimonadota bacterium]MXX71056.1 50S ribosomal protein L3 [Gemmatimonadota bacterium]MYC92562.1 50S ribosomal protein L3 [Gemmatimonadota bacterium]MYG34966.1 50S ribosomal protein L3 [Gemmatimonadota bacterium]MYJ16803.1 50S ribosomal protein L3 [Gemmatimonadota bacterium]